jgi:hypothetical protein
MQKLDTFKIPQSTDQLERPTVDPSLESIGEETTLEIFLISQSPKGWIPFAS